MIAEVLKVSDDFTIGKSQIVHKNVTVSVNGKIITVTMDNDVTEANIKAAVEARLSEFTVNDDSGVVGLKIPLGDAVKEVTGKQVFQLLSPYWQTIHNAMLPGGTSEVHGWRWNHFNVMISGYWDEAVAINNATLTGTLNGLVALGLVPEAVVNNFLGVS